MQSLRSLTGNNYLLTAVFCVCALALRGQIAGDAFWLDEIWSYYLMQLMDSPWDAFSKLRIDNNHVLNTLLLYWIGEQANWEIYRLPALLSGVATVALMGPAARLTGAPPWLAMLLGTISLPLIQYSAEARGYSSAALFGLAAWYICYARLEHHRSPVWLALFWASCILALMSHLTAVFVLTGLGASWVIDRINRGSPGGATLREALVVFGVPAAFSIWMYAYFYSRISAGGAATEVNVLANLLELCRLVMGAPAVPALAALAGILMCALLLNANLRLPATQRLFFGLTIFLLPGLLLSFYKPDFFYPRYVLVCLPFAYLLLARSLGDALQAGGWVRALGCTLLAGIIIGSGSQFLQLATWGKGDYPRAVADLYADAGERSFTVGSDFDFRNKSLLDFYTRYRADADQLVYVERSWEAAAPADYFIVHNQIPNNVPEPLLTLQSGNYYLLQQYPYWGLSGWNWYLYRHEDLPSGADTPPI